MHDEAAHVPTHVVTCFLLRKGPEGDRILLVQRSQAVRTYKGHWAAISGYLEPGVSPEEQAYTELLEEANLSREDVRLIRAGQPVEFRDESIDQSWVVHPFLFELMHLATLRTDWEAADQRWVAPEAVASYPTVPRLVEALRSVYSGGRGNVDINIE